MHVEGNFLNLMKELLILNSFIVKIKIHHMEQLMVYAALFCLEYRVKPGDIKIELRLYKNDEVEVFNPTAEDILPIMDKIVSLNKIMEEIDEGVI